MPMSSSSHYPSVRHVLGFPVYFLQLFSGAKSFEKNPLLGSRFLNRHGLHVLRVSTAMRMADWRRRRLRHLITEEQAESYERDGYVRIDNFLPEEQFQAVLAELQAGNFERVDMHQGATITRRSMIDDRDLVDRPALREARDSPVMMNLVRYVGSHAGQALVTLQSVLARFEGNADPQTDLHSDTFHATAKAWLFLTDVGEDDGPFCYVPGSHRMTPQRYDWERQISTQLDDVKNTYSRRGSLRLSAEALESLGYPEPVRMHVKANTLVVADTHGFHSRCASPKDTVRIEIYASLRRAPYLPFVASKLGGLHLAAVPFLRRRVNRLVVSGLRFTQRLGLRACPWRDIGSGAADEWTH